MRHDAVCVSVKKRVVCASSSIAGMSEYHVIFDLCFQILKLTICQIIKTFETNQSVPLLLREGLSFFEKNLTNVIGLEIATYRNLYLKVYRCLFRLKC